MQNKVHNMMGRFVFLWAGIITSCVAATWAMLVLNIHGTTAGIAYLVLVVLWSAQSSIAPALVLSVLCAICFDYYFLPPVHALGLSGFRQWFTMGCYFLCSLLVSSMTHRAQMEARKAEERRVDAERLYGMSQEVMLHEDAEDLLKDAPGIIARIFSLDTVVLYSSERDAHFASAGEDVQAENEIVTALRGLTQSQTIISPQAFQGYSAQPLYFAERRVGALAWSGGTLSHQMARAVCAQMAVAVTRALAMETFMRLETAREGEQLRLALIDSVTHELRTPLTAIRVAATTLLDGGDSLQEYVRRDLIAVVDEESKRLNALIGEAVEMAEIRADVLRVQPVPGHLSALLEQTIDSLQTKLVGHVVALEVAEPEQLVWVDRQLVGRVLRHLLENAAEHTPVGSRVVLRSRVREERAEFIVEDNGPGIAVEDLPHIFDKFYRSSRSREMTIGSGMGLAIARALVMAHGGEIDVESAPEQGARFSFWVPSSASYSVRS